jgi:hypothetical protein
MSEKENFESALVAVLFEINMRGIDLEDIKEQVSFGLMGGRIYHPAGASQKPQSIEALNSAINATKKYIEIHESLQQK